MPHSPLPWHVEANPGSWTIFDATGCIVSVVLTEADARFIVDGAAYRDTLREVVTAWEDAAVRFEPVIDRARTKLAEWGIAL